MSRKSTTGIDHKKPTNSSIKGFQVLLFRYVAALFNRRQSIIYLACVLHLLEQ